MISQNETIARLAEIQNKLDKQTIEGQNENRRLFQASDRQNRSDHELQQRYLNCIVIYLLGDASLEGQEIIDRCEKQAISPTGQVGDKENLFNRTDIDTLNEQKKEREKSSQPSNPPANPPDNEPELSLLERAVDTVDNLVDDVLGGL